MIARAAAAALVKSYRYPLTVPRLLVTSTAKLFSLVVQAPARQRGGKRFKSITRLFKIQLNSTKISPVLFAVHVYAPLYNLIAEKNLKKFGSRE